MSKKGLKCIKVAPGLYKVEGAYDKPRDFFSPSSWLQQKPLQEASEEVEKLPRRVK